MNGTSIIFGKGNNLHVLKIMSKYRPVNFNNFFDNKFIEVEKGLS